MGSLDDLEDTPNSQRAQNCGLHAQVNSQVKLRNEQDNSCANHNDKVENVPRVSEVVLFHGDDLDDSLQRKSGHKHVIYVLNHVLDLRTHRIPSQSKHARVRDNSAKDKSIKLRVLTQTDAELSQAIAGALYLDHRLGRVDHDLHLDPLALHTAQELVERQVFLLCVESLNDHTHEKVQEEQEDDDEQEHEKDDVERVVA